MFGADLPLVQAMHAGAALDQDPGPSVPTGDMGQYASVFFPGKHILDSVLEPGEWRARDQHKLDIDI